MKFYTKIMCGILAAGMCISGMVSCGKKGGEDAHYPYDLGEYITLPEYKGLEAVGSGTVLTEERIQAEIMAPLYFYTRIVFVSDRPAVMGDTVVVSYVGTCEGTQTESQSELEFVLGSGVKLEDFEASVVGHMAGDVFEMQTTYPDPYAPLPECAGKTVEFTISLDAIYETELPEYTDEFVKDYLGYSSIEAYESAVRESLTEFNETANLYSVIVQLWQKIAGETVVLQYPEKELTETYDSTVSAHKDLAEELGVSFTDYVTTYHGMTVEEFYEKVKAESKITVRDEMICFAIARAEGITLTEEEYTERALEYAEEQYGLDSVGALEEMYGKDMIYRLVLCDKVQEWIASEAKLVGASDAE